MRMSEGVMGEGETGHAFGKCFHGSRGETGRHAGQLGRQEWVALLARSMLSQLFSWISPCASQHHGGVEVPPSARTASAAQLPESREEESGEECGVAVSRQSRH